MDKQILADKDKQRLDKFLTEKLKNTSRSKIQNMIKQGLVLVDNKKVLSHYLLKTGQIINIKKEELKKEVKTKKIEMPKLEIIKDTKNYLIVNFREC